MFYKKLFELLMVRKNGALNRRSAFRALSEI
jgi:hypothetical protein